VLLQLQPTALVGSLALKNALMCPHTNMQFGLRTDEVGRPRYHSFPTIPDVSKCHVQETVHLSPETKSLVTLTQENEASRNCGLHSRWIVNASVFR
jgi:hypothetical protein